MSSEPLICVRRYLIVWFSLIALTVTTTAIAFIDLGAEWNTVVALVIAVGKALLVILYFMHLRYSERLTWIFAGAGFFWLLILLGGTLDDVLTRQSSPRSTIPMTAAVGPR